MRIVLIDPDPGQDGSAERHARTVPALGDRLVLAGETIDVPDDVAGHGAYWRKPLDGELDDPQHRRYLLDTGLLTLTEDGSPKSVHDLGAGLLAQPDVWAKADAIDLQKGGAE